MNCVTECMLRATSIGVGNVVVDMNTTSFNLMWTTNMAYNSSYFITLCANSENVMNISTNESFVDLIIQTNLSYSMVIYYNFNGVRKHLSNLQVWWFENNNSRNITIESTSTILTIICTSAKKCSSKGIKKTCRYSTVFGVDNFYIAIVFSYSSDST